MAKEGETFRAGAGEETRHTVALDHESLFIPYQGVSTLFCFFALFILCINLNLKVATWSHLHLRNTTVYNAKEMGAGTEGRGDLLRDCCVRVQSGKNENM